MAESGGKVMWELHLSPVVRAYPHYDVYGCVGRAIEAYKATNRQPHIVLDWEIEVHGTYVRVEGPTRLISIVIMVHDNVVNASLGDDVTRRHFGPMLAYLGETLYTQLEDEYVTGKVVPPPVAETRCHRCYRRFAAWSTSKTDLPSPIPTLCYLCYHWSICETCGHSIVRHQRTRAGLFKCLFEAGHFTSNSSYRRAVLAAYAEGA